MKFKAIRKKKLFIKIKKMNKPEGKKVSNPGGSSIKS
jgi:hypothetical protein